MSLMQCIDCGNTMSDAAPSCVRCGRPRQAVQTVELTGKKWKALQLWGGVFALLSPAMCIGGAKAATPDAMLGGMAMFAIGAGLFLVGRLGAFWYHR